MQTLRKEVGDATSNEVHHTKGWSIFSRFTSSTVWETCMSVRYDDEMNGHKEGHPKQSGFQHTQVVNLWIKSVSSSVQHQAAKLLKSFSVQLHCKVAAEWLRSHKPTNWHKLHCTSRSFISSFTRTASWSSYFSSPSQWTNFMNGNYLFFAS